MDAPPAAAAPETPGWVRRWWRRVAIALGIGTALVVLVVLIWAAPALHRRLFVFPREETAWAELRAQRRAVAEDAGWREFRGVLHAHSELSHDCEVPFPDILRAMPSEGHFGLRGLADLLTDAGGRLIVNSSAEAGTTIRAEVPR